MSDNDTTTTAGRRGEELAAQHLVRQGLRILARNYCCRGGEIDLVCRDGAALVFVEVRLRRSATFGGAGASITAGKQARVILAAGHYLAAHPSANRCACRFDCVLIEGEKADRIVWLRDAFSAD